MNIFQKYLIPLIIAAVFSSGAWTVKGWKTRKELNRMDKVLKSYADSMKNEKAKVATLITMLNHCQADSSVMKGQIQGLQKNGLILSNSNRVKDARINECEQNLQNAINTGIARVDTVKLNIWGKIKRKK